jgi:hypothetical protein
MNEKGKNYFSTLLTADKQKGCFDCEQKRRLNYKIFNQVHKGSDSKTCLLSAFLAVSLAFQDN